MATSENTIQLRCISGSTSTDVGEFIGLDETNIMSLSGDPFTVTVSPGGNPGHINIETNSLNSTDQGVYTCRIPDEKNNKVHVNVGIYLSGFNSE